MTWLRDNSVDLLIVDQTMPHVSGLDVIRAAVGRLRAYSAFELAALPRVVLLYPDGSETGIDDPLAAYGRPLGPSDLRTPYFLSAPLFVSGSDFVLCVPRRMADLVAASGDLVVVDFPEAEPFTYCVVWHDRAEMDAGLRWVRGRLEAALDAVPQD